MFPLVAELTVSVDGVKDVAVKVTGTLPQEPTPLWLTNTAKFTT
jgi:hypothetical protein